MRNLMLSALCLTLLQAAQPGEAIDAYVRQEMARQKIPGLAVAVVRHGQVVLAEGYGFADVEHRVPVTRETVFQSASVGKQLTAATVLRLVDQGRVTLDAPLTAFFADAPARWRDITVRHLLTHTSGLPDYTDGTLDYRRSYSEDELVRFAYGLTPEFPPGARWNYSNTGYVLLGAIVRKVTGRFYGDVAREALFLPLDMRSARVMSEAEIIPNRASGYRLVDGELRNQEWVSPELNTTADGSYYLSIDDMIAWDAGIRARALLTPTSWSGAFTPVTLRSGRTYPYGFGWDLEPFAGRPAQRHSGGWQGFATYIARYPQDDLSIIVLTNLAQASPGGIAEGIAKIVDPALSEPEPSPMADDDPAAQARVRALLEAAAAGRLVPADFAYVRAGFFPDRAAFYKERLSALGPVGELRLLERRALGDDTVHLYEAQYGDVAMRVRVAVAPDGKLAGFDVSPAPR